MHQVQNTYMYRECNIFYIKCYFIKCYCLFSCLQEVNADEFEDKEWTFVIEGVSIS